MKPTVFHSFITDKMKEKLTNPHARIVKREKVRIMLYTYGIPSVLHQRFLQELEKSGLIKLKDKQNIEILDKKE